MMVSSLIGDIPPEVPQKKESLDGRSAAPVMSPSRATESREENIRGEWLETDSDTISRSRTLAVA